MRPSLLFAQGLVFWGITLLAVGALVFRLLSPRGMNTTRVAGDDFQLLSPAQTGFSGSGLEPGITIQHTAAVGEWLAQVVRCYGATYSEVRDANPRINNPYELLPATTVTIPNIGSAGPIYGPPCVTFHAVQVGETWSSVARHYNADIEVLQAVNCALIVGSIVKVPLNSAGGGYASLLPEEPIPATPITISADFPSITQSSNLSPHGIACFEISATQAEHLSVQVAGSSDPIKVAIINVNDAAVHYVDTSFSLNATAPEEERYRVVVENTSNDAMQYSLQAEISTSAAPTRTPTRLPTSTPITEPTPRPGGRILFGPGETVAVRAGNINPSETIQYVLTAAKGQVLSITLTAPPNEVGIGVEGPMGSLLKPSDATQIWRTSITVDGDYYITIVASPGSSAISYNLEVGLSGTIPDPDLVPDLVIETEWPKRLETGRSDTIRVSLILVSDEAYSPMVEIGGHTASSSTAISVGTPGLSPVAAMGANHDVFAIPYLAAQAFQVSLGSSETQPLDQPRIDWIWSIISDQPNPQMVNVTIELHWEPRNGVGPPIQRAIYRSSPPLDIEVYKPFVTIGELSILALVSGLFGSGLSVPFLLEYIEKRKEKRGVKSKRKVASS